MATTERVPSGTLRERVAARGENLSASERRVAHYLADFPEEVAFASAGELGRVTQTSDATVIRTVKALGYDGLPALKRSLQTTVRERLTPAGRLVRSLDRIGTEPVRVLDEVLSDSIQILEEAQHSINADSFAQAVDIIRNARGVLVIGLGGLGILGRYLALRLDRLRRPARSAMASGVMLADDLLALQKDDVVVVVAHQAINTEIAVALDHANAVGAAVVLVTDTLGEALADRVMVSISAPIGPTGTFNMQVSTLAVLEALALAVAATARPEAVEAMTELNDLRDKLRGHSRAPADARRRGLSTGKPKRSS